MRGQSEKKVVRLIPADKSNAQHLLRYNGSHTLKFNLFFVWLLISDN